MGSRAFLLPLEMRGLYREMLSQAWRRGGRLPNDHEAIRRAVGATEKEWSRAWPKIESFWRVDGDDLVNDTQLEVYAEAKSRREKESNRGKAGAEARYKHSPGDAQADAQATAQASTQGHAQALASDLRSPIQSPTDSEIPPVRAFRKPPTGRTDGVMAGMLPKDHLGHICSPNLSWCVTPYVHSKLKSQLAPKFGGDQAKADAALRVWYEEVWASLPADAVMGDAFRFWQPRFDAKFATPTPVAKKTEPASPKYATAAELRERYRA